MRISRIRKSAAEVPRLIFPWNAHMQTDLINFVEAAYRVEASKDKARSKSALSSLQRSAAAMTRSRGILHTSEPERAVDEWKGLIAAHWTLLDVCEKDGTKYLVARQNQMKTPGPNGLTDREREVVALAVAGHHNKLIAYNLGISHSTVRVLMSRAAEKLGAHSREDLIRRSTPDCAPANLDQCSGHSSAVHGT
jgi:DNA-binding CsgD family transcriptional regulator